MALDLDMALMIRLINEENEMREEMKSNCTEKKKGAIAFTSEDLFARLLESDKNIM